MNPFIHSFLLTIKNLEHFTNVEWGEIPVCCVLCPQDQRSLRSGEDPQETSSWPRIPTCVSPWERTTTSGSCCATTAGVNSTSTRSASVSGNATTATFTEEPWKEPGQISFHPSHSSHENWKWLPERTSFPLRTCVSLVNMWQVSFICLKTAFYFRQNHISFNKTFVPLLWNSFVINESDRRFSKYDAMFSLNHLSS